MTRWLALLVAAAALAAPASSAVTGSHRALVILATWGPEPWTRAEVEEAVVAADRFIRRSSFDLLSLQSTVTPWLQGYPAPPVCPTPEHERIPPPLTNGPNEAAAAAGYDVASYDRLIYIVPQLECPWRGVGVAREVMLNGTMNTWGIVHELGHTYGLAHARARVCRNGTCRSDEYGDPISPMGHGLVDFSAYEKLTLGWISEVTQTSQAGSYEVGRPDVRSAAPHALVVPTAKGAFWFEQRLDVDPPGLSARITLADIPDDDLAPPTLFVDNPTRANRPLIAPDEVFREPGVLEVRYNPAPTGRATIDFRWIDRLRPGAPRLRVPQRARPGATVPARWSSADAGSGVVSCTLSLDKRVIVRGDATGAITIGPLRRGIRSVAARCVDRAGNSSRVTTKRIRVGR